MGIEKDRRFKERKGEKKALFMIHLFLILKLLMTQHTQSHEQPENLLRWHLKLLMGALPFNLIYPFCQNHIYFFPFVVARRKKCVFCHVNTK